MHIFCNAAFRSVTLYWFLFRIATGPEFSNALHYRKKRFGELTTFCNALHYRINCLGTLIFNDLRPDIPVHVKEVRQTSGQREGELPDLLFGWGLSLAELCRAHCLF